MASSTLSWKSRAERGLARRVWRAWWLVLVCLVWWPQPVRADAPRGAAVTEIQLEEADDGVYLTAQVEFELPSAVEEVLEKGIAVYFVAEAEVYRERWYWIDRKVAQAARHMRLAYQPLSRRWRLNVSPVPITNAGFGVTLGQSFDTLADALDGVRRIGRMRLGELSSLGKEDAYPVKFRFRLDTSQLPRPFQIASFGQSDWDISIEKNARLPLENAK
jgi:hypothetical protein